MNVERLFEEATCENLELTKCDPWVISRVDNSRASIRVEKIPLRTLHRITVVRRDATAQFRTDDEFVLFALIIALDAS